MGAAGPQNTAAVFAYASVSESFSRSGSFDIAVNCYLFLKLFTAHKHCSQSPDQWDKWQESSPFIVTFENRGVVSLAVSWYQPPNSPCRALLLVPRVTTKRRSYKSSLLPPAWPTWAPGSPWFPRFLCHFVVIKKCCGLHSVLQPSSPLCTSACISFSTTPVAKVKVPTSGTHAPRVGSLQPLTNGLHAFDSGLFGIF